MNGPVLPPPPADFSSRSLVEPYSPQLRTALLLTGTGTAGAYHAGVLRALHEAGVKIDVVGGHGVGVIGALFAAVDGAQRLWDEKGFWRSPAVRGLYPWRRMVRLAAGAMVAALAIVALPLAAIAIGLVVYPIDFVAKMVGLGQRAAPAAGQGAGAAGGLVDAYLRFTQAAFAPDALPTWLPRLAVLVLGAVAAMACVSGWMGAMRRSVRGPFWWRAVRAPLSSAEATAHTWQAMWDLVRGATPLKQPPAAELGRRYMELVGENIGQPGFRELVLVVHDLDARRDLTFALVAESRRRGLVRRATIDAVEERRAEVFDLSGVARDYLADVVGGALAAPLICEPRALSFAPDAYWRGETHRICDRPGSFARVLQELIELGAQQVVVVSAVSGPVGPHALTRARIDGRGRFGEYVESAEAAMLRDAIRLAAGPAVKLFPIRPTHNPIGPFDFDGGFDDRSDRSQSLAEIMSQGYEDAYRQFIEPVVGASGEQVGSESV
jgi:hypothetical protein